MTIFYSIGHSNRSLDAFIALLAQVPISLVVDVRTIPKSRHNPQFNSDSLAQSLNSHSIGYTRIPELGGLRSRLQDALPSANGFWENENFRNYADYAATPAFKKALDELLRLGQIAPSAMMCAEAVWWRCHRRIIADYLIAAGHTVFHIMGEGKLESAHLTSAAALQPGGHIVYPPAQQELPLLAR